MRPLADCVRVESDGSVWLINEQTLEYLRMPKQEIPRRADHSTGVLKDLVWHPFEKWEIDQRSGRLRITTTEQKPDGTGPVVISAPGAVVRNV